MAQKIVPENDRIKSDQQQQDDETLQRLTIGFGQNCDEANVYNQGCKNAANAFANVDGTRVKQAQKRESRRDKVRQNPGRF